MKKNKSILNKIFSILAIGALFQVACTSKPVAQKTNPTDSNFVFENDEPMGDSMAPRDVASEPSQGTASPMAITDLSPLTYKTLEDYFSSSNSNEKFVFHLYVSTDKDKTYLKETARKAIDEAFGKTFADLVTKSSGTEAPGGMGVILKGFSGNIAGAMIDNFVKTLKVLKIVDTDIQIDLVFYPEKITQDYEQDFSSNGYTSLTSQGQFSSRLKKAETEGPYQMIRNHIYRTSSNEVGQFLGGVISVKLAAANTSLFRGEDRLFDGQLTFRRYLVHPLQSKSSVITKEWVQSEGVEVKLRAQAPVNVSTIDFVHKFNRKNIKPVLERVDLYPGQFLSMAKIGEQPELYDVISEVNIKERIRPFGKFDSVKLKVSRLSFDPKAKLLPKTSLLDPFDYKMTGNESGIDSGEQKMSMDYLMAFKDEVASLFEVPALVRGVK